MTDEAFVMLKEEFAASAPELEKLRLELFDADNKFRVRKQWVNSLRVLIKLEEGRRTLSMERGEQESQEENHG